MMKRVVVIDADKKTKEEIKRIAIKELFNERYIKGNAIHNVLLEEQSINYYKVRSIYSRIVVASVQRLTSKEVQGYVADFLSGAHRKKRKNNEVT